MHEKQPVLAATKRERLGSRYAQRARAAGKLPAIVYGHGRPPVPIALDSRDTLIHINKGEKVFKLDMPGTSDIDEGQIVLLTDLQFDYLGTNIVHADFVRVDLNQRVHTKVHVNLIGDAPGLKTAGAILMHPVTELEIECRVTELPDHVDVEIGGLDVGHQITAADVKLPSDTMRLITDPHAIVAQIVVQKEQVATAEGAAVTTDAAQPEVITAKKPEEGAAADAKGGAKPAAPKAGGGEKKK
jgi:large subunit ribosomal protein L25